MMSYSKNYSGLLNLINSVAALTEDEANGLIVRVFERQPELRDEISRCFADPNFSWMEIFDHDEIRDWFDFETEEEAREFATEMFLKPTTS